MKEPSCEFCGIVTGAEELYQTNPYVESRIDPPYYSRYWVAWPDPAPLTRGHLLLVPYQHEVSIARLNKPQQEDLLRTSKELSTIVQKQIDEQKNTYYFEHGSTEEDEELGCIVHPHFHLIFTSKNILKNVEKDIWNEFEDIRRPWEKYGNSDYYMFGELGGEKTYATQIREAPELKCDMFIRKYFSGLLSKSEIYDYLRYKKEAEPDELAESVSEFDKILRNLNDS